MSQLGEIPESSLPQAPPFPNVPRAIASRRLGKDQADLVSLIGPQITATVLRLATCQTAKEFLDLRSEVFMRYAQLSLAVANVVAADPKTMAALTEDSFSEVEKVFREKGDKVTPSAEAYDEALFNISTLRRTYKLRNRIGMTSVPKQSEPEDRETADGYNSCVLWSQLHLDCLMLSITTDIKLSREIVPEILMGLRFAVMAYSYARHGVRLREFSRHFDFEGAVWDDTDASLAMQSTLEREVTLGTW
jgi:hypothetical protein